MAKVFLAASVVLLLACSDRTPGEEHGQKGQKRAGEPAVSVEGSFQQELNRLFMKGENRESALPLSSLQAGQKHRMTCDLVKNGQDGRELTIKFGDLPQLNNFALVTIDQKRRLSVVASTSEDEYIDDNVLQPEHIRSRAFLKTDPMTTYGHMNDTGYPYPAFGPPGRHAIILVDDAIAFQNRKPVTAGGKAPKVIAGCVVNWQPPQL